MARWLSSLLLLGVGVAGGSLIGHRVSAQDFRQSVPVGFNLVDPSQVTNPSGMSWPCATPVNGGCAQTVSITVSLKQGSAPAALTCGGLACIQFSGLAAATAVQAKGIENNTTTDCWNSTPVYATGAVIFQGRRVANELRTGGQGTTH
jgi:hypothetical protein